LTLAASAATSRAELFVPFIFQLPATSGFGFLAAIPLISLKALVRGLHLRLPEQQACAKKEPVPMPIFFYATCP
jgi:hypothetical protein